MCFMSLTLLFAFGRYDEQKRNVEEYRDWRDNLDELKPWLENAKSEMDACERPTSDHGVREKQTVFMKVRFISNLKLHMTCELLKNCVDFICHMDCCM